VSGFTSVCSDTQAIDIILKRDATAGWSSCASSMASTPSGDRDRRTAGRGPTRPGIGVREQGTTLFERGFSGTLRRPDRR